MIVTIYKDNLIEYGLCTEEDCYDDNLADVEVPASKVKMWYDERLREIYKMPFLDWYENESVAEDFEGGFLYWAMEGNPETWEVYLD